VVDAVLAVYRFGGAATRAELLGAGVARRAAERAVRDGRLLTGDGAFWAPDADHGLVLACRTRSWTTCVSALARWSVPLLVEPTRPHLATTRARQDRAASWHRLREAAPGDRGDDPRTRSVLPLTAVVHALRCLPRRDGLVVADASLRSGLVTRRELDRALPAHDPRGTRWVLKHADHRSESVLESALRYELITAGLTGFRPQAHLRGVGRVDLLLDGWLVLEADGFEHHSGKADFLLDRERLAGAAQSGHVTLRFGYQAIVHHPGAVVRCIQQTRRQFASEHARTTLTVAGPIRAGQWTSERERGAQAPGAVRTA